MLAIPCKVKKKKKKKNSNNNNCLENGEKFKEIFDCNFFFI